MDFVLGSEMRSGLRPGGKGDLEGGDGCDICEVERDEGNEDSEVRLLTDPLTAWATLLRELEAELELTAAVDDEGVLL